jgi:dimethylhistidine N-methyltransferase
MLLTSEKAVDLQIPELKMETQFLEEVLCGLRSIPKKLEAKYFYDQTGDMLFQKIMDCEEYYVTRCESEIFKTHAMAIASALKGDFNEFDLIELGAGDATKTIYLLKQFIQMHCNFSYFPVDISESIIQYLEQELPGKVPGLVVKGLNGEYLEMLKLANRHSDRKKAVLFLGSNIGNMNSVKALEFLKEVRASLNTGDKILIGFDLKKDPATILAAYNDLTGYTRAFNLNLLERINQELNGTFDISQFAHYPTYDPISGECKSFLVSGQDQQVFIANQPISFKKGEVIYMELSQKYDLQEIQNIANAAGFVPRSIFTDSRKWFVDVIWECV